ncbi:AtpZ/AtpI family protein [Aquibacillus koreensis]|uniref:AtpZ/AtpI family protein n=2 Tax=Aquibacillus koreensis TaxID=279446 RepID=A0A9X3WJH2_9BACI|nr:AtpZ/AtpI family protein [Aquibacillus koreensis]MCT2535087.1 AtpZ/AtpI family protein [Aquibacillus koreensis]MDC3419730.1 AtpZ/AtpI family protein [Aquibacillus koreensis]
MALTSSVLAQLVGGPLVGIYIGTWLDDRLSTDPLFLILALILGLAAGIYGTIHLVRKYTGD